MSKSRLLFTLFFSQLLLACSPHPASGQWQSISIGNSEIVLIDVKFDGKAEMHGRNNGQIVRRCFWAGQDSKTISLTCVHPENTDIDIKYQFQVTGDQATLLLASQTIANFRKQ